MVTVMRRLRLAMAAAVVAGTATAASLTVAAPAWASRAGQGGSYSFVLAPADTAVAPTGGMMASPGDWIKLTGSGTFDPGDKTVSAHGTFAHFNAAGRRLSGGHDGVRFHRSDGRRCHDRTRGLNRFLPCRTRGQAVVSG